MKQHLTAIIEREADLYVALCPELGIASQGASVEAARLNLQEAVEGFYLEASPAEVAERLRGELYITQLEVTVG
ncbi:MAG: type II toxin-antitoxin system HicB family antitoxin [Fimbriimonadaceae bacterium]|nr:type II toxin-antitoxin system HicB family antitoxin [Fimbriimonadaceae bacterium]